MIIIEDFKPNKPQTLGDQAQILNRQLREMGLLGLLYIRYVRCPCHLADSCADRGMSPATAQRFERIQAGSQGSLY